VKVSQTVSADLSYLGWPSGLPIVWSNRNIGELAELADAEVSKWPATMAESVKRLRKLSATSSVKSPRFDERAPDART
jgi:hypothetical protein